MQAEHGLNFTAIQQELTFTFVYAYWVFQKKVNVLTSEAEIKMK